MHFRLVYSRWLQTYILQMIVINIRSWEWVITFSQLTLLLQILFLAFFVHKIAVHPFWMISIDLVRRSGTSISIPLSPQLQKGAMKSCRWLALKPKHLQCMNGNLKREGFGNDWLENIKCLMFIASPVMCEVVPHQPYNVCQQVFI